MEYRYHDTDESVASTAGAAIRRGGLLVFVAVSAFLVVGSMLYAWLGSS